MSALSETTGTWFRDGTYIYEDHRLGRAIAQVKQSEMAPRTDEELEAIAQLIVSVPDLLEACKTAKKYLEPDLIEPGRAVFWKLVAAIAKAEGR